MRVVRAVIIGVLGIAVVGGGTAAALEVRDNITEGKRCGSIRAQVAERGAIVETGRGGSVAIIGDSYSAGDGLDEYTDAWAHRVGSRVAGVGMTGFTNGGYCGDGTFGERLPSLLLEAMPATLIVQGGLNDTEGDPNDVAAAASAVLASASSVSRIVVVGPVDVPGREGEAAVDAALRSAAESSSREYVSALDWELDYLPDAVHLTSTGHADFAEKVADALD